MNKLIALFLTTTLAITLTACEKPEADALTLEEVEKIVETLEGEYIGLVDYGTITNSNNVTINSNTITITEGGTYTVVGQLTNGQLIIDSDAETNIILNNASITNQTSAAIYILDADLTTITLEEGTTSTLTDGSDYSYTTEGINATLYSKDILVIDGEGTLVVNANYNDGIISKDSLTIESGTITINSVGDAIYGKDDLTINGGTINITTYTGSAGVDMSAEEGTTGGPGGGRPLGKTITLSTTTDETSSKGMKSQGLITINDGTFTIDAYDDAIHSDTEITINNGTFNIKSGDDGMHADETLTINDGVVNITYCYEGIESNTINIVGGTISVIATDDGLNAPTLNSVNGTINISGGTTNVVASGDGLDSNGSLYVTGGIVYVEGSSDGSNGALDYDNSGYANGGTILATGNSQMAQGFTTSSTSSWFMGTFNGMTISLGSTVQIQDTSGTVLASTVITNSFNSVVFSSSELISGNTYYVVVNGTQYSITAN